MDPGSDYNERPIKDFGTETELHSTPAEGTQGPTPPEETRLVQELREEEQDPSILEQKTTTERLAQTVNVQLKETKEELSKTQDELIEQVLSNARLREELQKIKQEKEKLEEDYQKLKEAVEEQLQTIEAMSRFKLGQAKSDIEKLRKKIEDHVQTNKNLQEQMEKEREKRKSAEMTTVKCVREYQNLATEYKTLSERYRNVVQLDWDLCDTLVAVKHIVQTQESLLQNQTDRRTELENNNEKLLDEVNKERKKTEVIQILRRNHLQDTGAVIKSLTRGLTQQKFEINDLKKHLQKVMAEKEVLQTKYCQERQKTEDAQKTVTELTEGLQSEQVRFIAERDNFKFLYEDWQMAYDTTVREKEVLSTIVADQDDKIVRQERHVEDLAAALRRSEEEKISIENALMESDQRRQQTADALKRLQVNAEQRKKRKWFWRR